MAVSRGQSELIEFKIAAGYMISIGGQVMMYTYIPTEINRELVWIVTGMGKLSGLLKEELWLSILVDKLNLKQM